MGSTAFLKATQADVEACGVEGWLGLWYRMLQNHRQRWYLACFGPYKYMAIRPDDSVLQEPFNSLLKSL